MRRLISIITAVMMTALKEYAELHGCSLYEATLANLDTKLFQKSSGGCYTPKRKRDVKGF